MLCYQTPIQLITIVDDIDEKGAWQYGLLKTIPFDVFVAVEDSYPKKQLEEIQKYVKKLKVLPRQAANTSTTDFIQNTVKRHLDEIYKRVLNN